MKPHFKLHADGHIQLLATADRADNDVHRARAQIRKHYGTLQRFAARFNLRLHTVHRALHFSIGQKSAGDTAQARALLGLSTAERPRGQALADWHRNRRIGAAQ